MKCCNITVPPQILLCKREKPSSKVNPQFLGPKRYTVARIIDEVLKEGEFYQQKAAKVGTEGPFQFKSHYDTILHFLIQCTSLDLLQTGDKNVLSSKSKTRYRRLALRTTVHKTRKRRHGPGL